MIDTVVIVVLIVTILILMGCVMYLRERSHKQSPCCDMFSKRKITGGNPLNTPFIPCLGIGQPCSELDTGNYTMYVRQVYQRYTNSYIDRRRICYALLYAYVYTNPNTTKINLQSCALCVKYSIPFIRLNHIAYRYNVTKQSTYDQNVEEYIKIRNANKSIDDKKKDMLSKLPDDDYTILANCYTSIYNIMSSVDSSPFGQHDTTDMSVISVNLQISDKQGIYETIRYMRSQEGIYDLYINPIYDDKDTYNLLYLCYRIIDFIKSYIRNNYPHICDSFDQFVIRKYPHMALILEIDIYLHSVPPIPPVIIDTIKYLYDLIVVHKIPFTVPTVDDIYVSDHVVPCSSISIVKMNVLDKYDSYKDIINKIRLYNDIRASIYTYDDNDIDLQNFREINSTFALVQPNLENKLVGNSYAYIIDNADNIQALRSILCGDGRSRIINVHVEKSCPIRVFHSHDYDNLRTMNNNGNFTSDIDANYYYIRVILHYANIPVLTAENIMNYIRKCVNDNHHDLLNYINQRNLPDKHRNNIQKIVNELCSNGNIKHKMLCFQHFRNEWQSRILDTRQSPPSLISRTLLLSNHFGIIPYADKKITSTLADIYPNSLIERMLYTKHVLNEILKFTVIK